MKNVKDLDYKRKLNRVLKRVQLTPQEWDDMFEDFKDGKTKLEIMAIYNLNSFDYKILKKYFLGR